VCCTRIRADFP